MAITVTQLTAFLAVVRNGSVTAAAEELRVSQPSVSSALASLSREVGCELFERVGRGIGPSPAGVAFAGYAGDVIGLLEDGRRAAREAAARSAGELRVAALTTAAETFLPGLLARFGETHGGVRVALSVATAADVTSAILEHRANLGVLARAPGDPRLSAQALETNALACISAPDDPLAGGPPATAAQLTDRIWLMREPGSATRLGITQFLTERGLTPETLTLGSNAAVKQAVRAGLGIAVVSRAVVADELSRGELGEIPLSDGPAEHPWLLVRSAVGPGHGPTTAFAAFARQSAVG